MLNRSLNPVLVRLAIVAAALALLTLVAPVAFAATSVPYAENGTAPVLTFSATDQDGDAIVWSLAGDDAARFNIDGGVLSFKSPPDYEKPNSKSVGTVADRNVYNVTVQATGGSEAVTVTVTNVDEDGSVSFSGEGQFQPQVGRGLVASLSDQDGGLTDEKWQWARSMDMETWTDIMGSTSQSRSPVAADGGYYLRASVTYMDSFGAGKTASAVTGNMVEVKTVANAGPSFSGQDETTGANAETPTNVIIVTRSLDENMAVASNIGKPLSASDADNDVLVYSIVKDPAGTPETSDDEKFSIVTSTGQLRVGVKLDFEVPTDVGDTDNAYTVTVKAVDPSGASAEQLVTITVMPVNEAAIFDTDNDEDGNQAPPEVLRVTENQEETILDGSSGTDTLSTTAYAAADEDTEETAITYSVEGADQKYFNEADAGGLAFLTTDTHTPDYESKSSYSITVVATSGAGNRLLRSKVDVTINVVDAEDEGSVSLSQREPQIGRAVVATLTDKDGGVVVSEWKWERSDDLSADQTCEDDASTWTNIGGASSAVYTPKDADDDACLRATVTYTDNIDGPGTGHDDDTGTDGLQERAVSERPVQDSNPANTAPKFPDQNPGTPGDQSDSTSRTVAENTDAGQPIGAPVGADDGDLLMYSLGGADAVSFGIDEKTGQINTKADLDYETKNEYMVMLTAMDPSGASDSIMVTINVTDVNDGAVITGTKSVSYAENGTDPVATFSARDQDGDAIVWSLAGDDAARFNIDGGVLSFKSPPDYEKPNSKSVGTVADRNVYNVTVQATGGSEAVIVTVTNVDEDGSVSFSGEGRFQPQVGRGLVASLSDQDGGLTDEKWQWARSMDMETWTDIMGSTSQSRSPVAADGGYYLRASVTYMDSFGAGKTASAVTGNMVEVKTVANAGPSFSGQDETTGANAETPTNVIIVTRSLDENMAVASNIGKPLSASDADNDVLVYSIVKDPAGTPETSDDEKFSIVTSTGQLRVGVKLDFEVPTDVGDTDNAYTVTVKAVDPSGASAEQLVTITVMPVNEAAIFDTDNDEDGNQAPPEVLRVTENQEETILDGSSGTDTLSTTAYAAADEDTEETAITYSVEGADQKYFNEADAGGLAFLTTDTHTPDYESKSSYSITVVATSGAGNRLLRSKVDVTINVVDAEDEGSVSLSQREPQIGRAVVATLTDKDGGVVVSEWKWERSNDLSADQTCEDDASTWTNIGGASSAVYTPKDADDDACLRATVTYTDNIDGPGTGHDDDTGTDGLQERAVSERPVQDSNPANTAPKFPDQNPGTPGDQSDSTSRTVAENTDAGQPIGAPVGADDGDLLMYSLGGADAVSFGIDEKTGQINTKADLDYETKNEYMVMLTAMDPSGASDSIMVTINVTDVNDGAAITVGAVADPSECVTGGAVADGANAGLVSDCEALLASEEALVGTGTGLNWDASTPIGDWDGVSVAGGRVTNIYLWNHGLAGMIHARMNDLTGLQRLQLHDNGLTGPIPDLSGLDDLEWLILHRNAFTGGIPASLGGMDSIDYLYLYSNDGGFDGGIPAELGDATTLRRLYLHDNGLTGEIPGELGDLPILRSLLLSRNELNGSIPSELGDLTDLKALYLYSNNLTGSIPMELGNLMSSADDTLRILYLHKNMLTGQIPSELGNLTALTNLWLNGNTLSGNIPNELGNLTKLARWRLSGNMLTGCIPMALVDVMDSDMAATGLSACAN